MVDLNNIVKGLSRSGALGGFAGGLAGSAVAGALSGKKGIKVARSALRVGALAAIGGLAYTAYQRYRQNNSSTTDVQAGAASQSAAGRAFGRPVHSEYRRFFSPTSAPGRARRAARQTARQLE